MANTFDATGGVITTNFGKHMAEVKRAEATVLKKDRLWREEQESDRKRKTDITKKKGSGKGGEAAVET